MNNKEPLKDTCGQCTNFTGAGDWDLCCTISHPTPEEKKQGKSFSFGHLCYESTPACDMFNRGSTRKFITECEVPDR